MSERYSRIFSLPEDLYCEGAPVIIRAGALLKDNESGRLLAQLKLGNIGDKTVRLAKVAITPFDTVGRPLGDAICHEYLDLDAARDAAFGTQSPIKLPNTATRAFSARVVEVAFADGSIWGGEGEWAPLPKQETITTALDGDALRGYHAKYGTGATRTACEHCDLWLCTCGAVNHRGEATCHRCGAPLADLTSLDPEALKAEGVYAAASALYESDKIDDVKKAANLFATLPHAQEAVKKCEDRIEALTATQAVTKKKI